MHLVEIRILLKLNVFWVLISIFQKPMFLDNEYRTIRIDTYYNDESDDTNEDQPVRHAAESSLPSWRRQCFYTCFLMHSRSEQQPRLTASCGCLDNPTIPVYDIYYYVIFWMYRTIDHYDLSDYFMCYK